MKKYKEMISELTVMQRMKKSITARRFSKKAAIKRKLAMRKPPTPEKVQKALNRELRQKALSIVDKQGVYQDAAAGTKANLEKKASMLLTKKKSVWTKKLKPEVRKRMKDAFKQRVSSQNPES
tara:strand:- start:97 stop:465 length:369 start_codon:yes stop_codon:yes gene_type:complete